MKTLAEIERQLEELCNDVKELSAHQQMATEAKPAKPTPWRIPEIEDEEESVAIDSPVVKTKTDDLISALKWNDKIDRPGLKRVLLDLPEKEAQRLIREVNAVFQRWLLGDPSHQVFSYEEWPTSGYEYGDEDENKITLRDVINRFFPTMGVAHNSDDLTFVLYSKT